VTQSRPRIVPEATVARLAVYLRVLAGLADGGRSHVSSGELAAAAGVNPAGLRKDLSYLGPCGVRGVGYSVAGLQERLTAALGVERSRPCVLVGIIRSSMSSATGVTTMPSRPLNAPASSGGHIVVGPSVCCSASGTENGPR